MQTDEDFAADFRARFLGPKVATTMTIYRRAGERGELAPGADPALLGPALAGILLHRALVLGEPDTPERVARVLDQIILPAATGRLPTPAAPGDPDPRSPGDPVTTTDPPPGPREPPRPRGATGRAPRATADWPSPSSASRS